MWPRPIALVIMLESLIEICNALETSDFSVASIRVLVNTAKAALLELDVPPEAASINTGTLHDSRPINRSSQETMECRYLMQLKCSAARY